jgi:hypothetical protein
MRRRRAIMGLFQQSISQQSIFDFSFDFRRNSKPRIILENQWLGLKPPASIYFPLHKKNLRVPLARLAPPFPSGELNPHPPGAGDHGLVLGEFVERLLRRCFCHVGQPCGFFGVNPATTFCEGLNGGQAPLRNHLRSVRVLSASGTLQKNVLLQESDGE